METETITKSKRIKKVFGNISDIVHLFAHEKQDEARCRNAFFEGEVIYSYGRHFPIARIYTQNRGKKNEKKTVFFTTRTWSSTTSQHISSVRQACNHMNLLYMKNPILSDSITWKHSYHDENMMDFVKEINILLEKFPKQREGKEWSYRCAKEQLRMLNKYIEFFKLKTYLPKAVKSTIKLMTDPKWQQEIDAWKKKKAEQEAYYEANKTEIDEKRDKEKKRKQELAQAKALKDAEEKIAEWRTGEYRRFNYQDLLGLSLLRYNSEKERIETSQGVQVPVEAAHRLYRQIKVVLSRGSCITEDACAEKILDYSVREITTEHLKVGCHTIKMTEIEEMAKQLKWND